MIEMNVTPRGAANQCYMDLTMQRAAHFPCSTRRTTFYETFVEIPRLQPIMTASMHWHFNAFFALEISGSVSNNLLFHQGFHCRQVMLSRLNILSCKFYFFASLLRVVFAFGKILNLIPLCTKVLQKLFLKWTKCRMHPDDFWHTMFTSEMQNTLLYVLWRDMVKKARVGESAINVPLQCLDDKSPGRNLLDFQTPGRPLVLNFGSCSWPEFMADLQEFRRMVRHFRQQVDFVVLYIEEVHPTDGWAFKVKWMLFMEKWLFTNIVQACQ